LFFIVFYCFEGKIRKYTPHTPVSLGDGDLGFISYGIGCFSFFNDFMAG
jgi:hypothetical protein